MVPNIKYYVVTVASIFLALGVGIFMGFMLDAQGLVSSQKDEIVTQLEAKFDELKQESENTKQDMELVKTKNEQINTFLQDAYPILVKEALAGRNIALVGVNGDYNYSDLAEGLELAGAKVGSVTSVKESIAEDEEAIRAVYKEIVGVDFEGELCEMIASELVLTLSRGEKSEVLERLVQEGYVAMSGSYEVAVDSIVLTGGSKAENEQSAKLSKSLVDKTKEMGKTVVGVERSDVEISQIEDYKSYRISSVDNVETALGKTSLTLVLRGTSGNYGVKETATGVYPELDSLMENQGGL